MRMCDFRLFEVLLKVADSVPLKQFMHEQPVRKYKFRKFVTTKIGKSSLARWRRRFAKQEQPHVNFETLITFGDYYFYFLACVHHHALSLQGDITYWSLLV